MENRTDLFRRTQSFSVKSLDSRQANLGRTLIFLLFSLLVSQAAPAARLNCSQVFDAQTRTRDTGGRVAALDNPLSPTQAILLRLKLRSYFKQNIEQSKFNVGRGVEDYYAILKLRNSREATGQAEDSLENTVSQLKPSSHVVDLGAGTFQFINDLAASAGSPNFTGITMTDLSRRYFGYEGREIIVPKREDLARNPKINVIEGKYFEEIPNAKITSQFGQADLVVDLFGVLTYSMNLGLSIEKISSLLKAGGDLWMGTDYSKIAIDAHEISMAEFFVETGLFELVGTNASYSPTTIVSHLKRTTKNTSKLDLRLRGFEIQPVGGSPQADWVWRKTKR